MATAVVDMDINEGDTFIMALEFWDDVDYTLPIDISGDTFNGSFIIGTKTIPMVITQVDTNVIEARVSQDSMHNLQRSGKYDIDQLTASGDSFRLIQGKVRVSPEVTT